MLVLCLCLNCPPGFKKLKKDTQKRWEAEIVAERRPQKWFKLACPLLTEMHTLLTRHRRQQESRRVCVEVWSTNKNLENHLTDAEKNQLCSHFIYIPTVQYYSTQEKSKRKQPHHFSKGFPLTCQQFKMHAMQNAD